MHCLRLNRRRLLLILLAVSVVSLFTISSINWGIARFPLKMASDIGNGVDGSTRPLTVTEAFLVPENGIGVITNGSDTAGGGGQGETKVNQSVAAGGKPGSNILHVTQQMETVVESFPWTPSKAADVDCNKLFQGDRQEAERAHKVNFTDPPLSDRGVANVASAANCAQFTKQFGFITDSLSQEEKGFPIAFSLVVFKDGQQVLNLIRAIYRPQNFYCIHVDSKAKGDFKDAMKAIAHCFPNVFLSSRSIDVKWGEFTVLEPELICMKDLWAYKSWKYLINLTGQEFPLRTNYELVKILKAYNGANNLEGTRKRANRNRWENAGQAPEGIVPTKGSIHITVNRDFVDFVLHSPQAAAFLDWTRGVSIPDEVFFSSINHAPHLGIRGTYQGEPETHATDYPFLTRYKNWGDGPFDYSCSEGKRVRMICILSIGDLPLLDTRPELFANKFYADYSRVPLECLAERNFNHTRDEYFGKMDFNVTFYANMPFVKNMVQESTFNRTTILKI